MSLDETIMKMLDDNPDGISTLEISERLHVNAEAIQARLSGPLSANCYMDTNTSMWFSIAYFKQPQDLTEINSQSNCENTLIKSADANIQEQVITDDTCKPVPEENTDVASEKKEAEPRKLDGDSLLKISVQCTKYVNYAFQHNGFQLIQTIKIANNSDINYENVVLHIASEPEFLKENQRALTVIPANNEIEIKDIIVDLVPLYLASMTEKSAGKIIIQIIQDDIILQEEVVDLTLLAFDQWQGYSVYPELITAFITPNHPLISNLLTKAAALLEEWTGNPSLDGYQSKNPNRIRNMSAAVYAAIQSENIIYCEPPASFESGQRIRLCDTVLNQKLGTCLDMSLLYCSCIEAIGLHPLIIFMKGHAFSGVWLIEQNFSEAVIDDVSQLAKRSAIGVNEMTLIECTAMCSGSKMNFTDAESTGQKNIIDIDNFQIAIDVNRARVTGITPLPQRLINIDGEITIIEKDDDSSKAQAPKDLTEISSGSTSKIQELGKVDMWERKLLDLSLRNMLINLRIRKNIIPLLLPSLDELSDGLTSGRQYSIAACPLEMEIKDEVKGNLELYAHTEKFSSMLKTELKNGHIRAGQKETDLKNSVISLYRSSRTALEENGANTLYVALGILRWYENPKSEAPRYAPLILIPVELIRKSAGVGYVLRMRDEEPVFNVTLLEMLKQDFNLKTDEISLQQDDDGKINVLSVLTIMRHCIMPMTKWDIINSAFLGLFSFSQFVMWNDVKNRIDDLKENKIVSSLIDGHLDWNAEPMVLGDTVPEDNVLLTVPADASQLFAIEEAEKGNSFVLHGPPGTGKSQTITALIANSLAKGKSVLFVAEKMAALSVVQQRLNKIGIAPFCLELHSNKSKKKDVLNQLKTAAEISKKQTPEEYEDDIEQIQRIRSELQKYAAELKKQRLCGMSIFEMIEEYELYPENESELVFPVDLIEKITPQKLKSMQSTVAKLAAAQELIKNPKTNPLRYIRSGNYSISLKSEIPLSISKFKEALVKLVNSGDSVMKLFASAIGGNCKSAENLTQNDWDDLLNLTSSVYKWAGVNQKLAESKDIPVTINQLKNAILHHNNVNGLKGLIEQKWNKEILSKDNQPTIKQWNDSQNKWFMEKRLMQASVWKAVEPYAGSGTSKEMIPDLIRNLDNYQKELNIETELQNSSGISLPEIFGDHVDNAAYCIEYLDILLESYNYLRKVLKSDNVIRTFANDPSGMRTIEQLHSNYNESLVLRKQLSSRLDIEAIIPNTVPWIQNEMLMYMNISNHISDLRDWMAWRNTCNEAISEGLSPVIEAIENGLPSKALSSTFKKSILKLLINSSVDHSEGLNSFSGILFDEKVAQFRDLDKKLLMLNRQEIYSRLASRVPSFEREAVNSSEVGILQHAIRSNGRGISIRQLFTKIPNLLNKLCPCMLMSPISAAQYLDPKRTPFDLVVFDEASQLQTYKAVGAIARGKNCIVVGDPKQMPPTSFFTSSMVDEENLDKEDLDSILDDCLALCMPQTHLLWHYRSRSESLIAFSNREFYGNHLYTFPSPSERESKVSFVYVNGVFDRGHTRQNKQEASAVVKEIVRRAHDASDSKQTVGVVTFNTQQQELIDDMIQEKCVTDDVLDKWISKEDEPLFIKNLENVQGDERDVILFSIGFGPDSRGKIFMNFGPINKDGGGRRLNVAVSRARMKMIVYSSLHSDQIDMSRTSQAGVQNLQEFLRYAETGKLPETVASTEKISVDNGIVSRICEYLKQKGYKTNTSIGHSKFKVDIGVIDPRNSSHYILGIILDGESYQSAKTIHDREVSQVDVLTDLGWQLYRIWTMDWWDNASRELEKLNGKLMKLVAESPTELPDNSEKSDQVTAEGSSDEEPQFSSSCVNQTAEPEQTEQRQNNDQLKTYSSYQESIDYQISPNEYVSGDYDLELKSHLQRIIDEEAPISENLLITRVTQLMSFARAGNRIKDHTMQLVRSLRLYSTVSNGIRFYWKNIDQFNNYHDFRVNDESGIKRNAIDICKQEAANCAKYVINNEIGLPKDDLARQMAREFGYERLGTNVISVMNIGIDYAEKSAMIKSDENDYYTLVD